MKQIKVNGILVTNWDEQVSRCRGCGMAIGLALTEKGKKMPFDFYEKKLRIWRRVHMCKD